jgi:hypothetical protein
MDEMTLKIIKTNRDAMVKKVPRGSKVGTTQRVVTAAQQGINPSRDRPAPEE